MRPWSMEAEACSFFRYLQEMNECMSAPYKKGCDPAVSEMQCEAGKASVAPVFPDCVITCPSDPAPSSSPASSPASPATKSSVTAEVTKILANVLPCFVLTFWMFYLSPRKIF